MAYTIWPIPYGLYTLPVHSPCAHSLYKTPTGRIQGPPAAAHSARRCRWSLTGWALPALLALLALHQARGAPRRGQPSRPASDFDRPSQGGGGAAAGGGLLPLPALLPLRPARCPGIAAHCRAGRPPDARGLPGRGRRGWPGDWGHWWCSRIVAWPIASWRPGRRAGGAGGGGGVGRAAAAVLGVGGRGRGPPIALAALPHRAARRRQCALHPRLLPPAVQSAKGHSCALNVCRAAAAPPRAAAVRSSGLAGPLGPPCTLIVAFCSDGTVKGPKAKGTKGAKGAEGRGPAPQTALGLLAAEALAAVGEISAHSAHQPPSPLQQVPSAVMESGVCAALTQPSHSPHTAFTTALSLVPQALAPRPVDSLPAGVLVHTGLRNAADATLQVPGCSRPPLGGGWWWLWERLKSSLA